MKYLSIDIETTGLDSENHQILSIGVIVEDTEKKLPFDEIPKFHCAIVRDEIRGGLFALNMNAELIRITNAWTNANKDGRDLLERAHDMVFLKEGEVAAELFRFLFRNSMVDKSIYATFGDGGIETILGIRYPAINRVNTPSKLSVAGKNFATFDKLFLEKLPRWKQLFKINQRIIDPAVLFTKWTEDEQLPNLTLCKERAGLDGVVSHNAVEDAWDVITLLRTQYEKN